MALDMTTALTIRAKVDGLAQIDGLSKSLDKANNEAKGLEGTFGKVKGAAGGLTGALGVLVPAAAVAGLTTMAKGAIDSADNLNDLSQRTGVAVETLSKFGAAAEDSGSSIDEVAKAMGKLSKGIVDPASKANEALRSIGVASTDSAGKVRSVDAIMLDLADKFAKMPDGAEKTALAMDLFGKSGMNLIPMLNQGKDALSQYSATIDTEMAQAADKFNDALNEIGRQLAGPFNEAMTALLPLITQLAQSFGELVAKLVNSEAFQKFIQVVADMALRVAENLLPVLDLALKGFMALFDFFDNLPPGLKDFLLTMGEIGLTIAALAPIITPIVALLTGPLGIVVAITAVIAIAWQFRDEIGAAFQGAWEAVSGWFSQIGQIPATLYDIFVQPVIDAIGQLVNWFKDGFVAVFDFIKEPFMQAMQWLNENFVQPVIQFGQQLVDWYMSGWAAIFDFIKQPFEQGWQWIQENFIQPVRDAFPEAIEYVKNAWSKMQDILAAPFIAVVNIVKGAINGVMGLIENGINGAVAGINNLIAAANRVPGVNIPTVSPVQLPRFAEGGVVSGPTIAMVGEGGEPEYIVPQSKASGFAANWMAGKRGASAIPRFAEGGVVVPSANVSIQTGPVTQMNGTNYVTTQDLSRAVQAGVNQTLSLIAGDGSVRRQLGMA